MIFACVCVRACFGAHISLCLSSCICMCVGLNVCVCAPAWKIKRGPKSEPYAPYSQHAIKSRVLTKVIYYSILCLVFAQWLRREHRDAATATDNMFINWGQHHNATMKRGSSKMAATRTGDYCSQSSSVRAGSRHSLCDLKTAILGRWGGDFPWEFFQVRRSGRFESFCRQVDSKIVLWKWNVAKLVYMQALSLCLWLSGPLVSSKMLPPPLLPPGHPTYTHSAHGSVDAMPHSRLVYTHCPSL